MPVTEVPFGVVAVGCPRQRTVQMQNAGAMAVELQCFVLSPLQHKRWVERVQRGEGGSALPTTPTALDEGAAVRFRCILPQVALSCVARRPRGCSHAVSQSPAPMHGPFSGRLALPLTLRLSTCQRFPKVGPTTSLCVSERTGGVADDDVAWLHLSHVHGQREHPLAQVHGPGTNMLRFDVADSLHRSPRPLRPRVH